MHRKTRGERFGQGWDDALPAIRAKRLIADQIRFPSVRRPAYTAVRPGYIVKKKTPAQRFLLAAGILSVLALFSTGGVGIVILSSHGIAGLPQAAPAPVQDPLYGVPASRKQKAGQPTPVPGGVPNSADITKTDTSAKKPAQSVSETGSPTVKPGETQTTVQQKPAADADATAGGTDSTKTPTSPTIPVTPEETTAQAARVTYDGTVFDIRNVMLDLGGSLTFVNASTADLRPVCDDGTAADPCHGTVIAPGATWSITPGSAGAWKFHDQLNTAATGMLTVY